MEPLVVERETQDLGLGAHQLGIARGERVNDRVRRRAPGLVEIDERAVFIQQNPDNGHGRLSQF